MNKLSKRVNFKINDDELSLIRKLADLHQKTLSNEIRKIIRGALAENNLMGQYIPTALHQKSVDQKETKVKEGRGD